MNSYLSKCSTAAMMFVIDLNMSPQQDNASDPADQQEEHNSQQRYNNEEPVNNEATGTTSKTFAFSFSFP